MRKLFLVFISTCLIFTSSCDDGDIITVELDFENTYFVCEGVSGLVFYKTKDDPSESLSLEVANLKLDTILSVKEEDNFIREQNIDLSTANAFTYRTYSNETLPKQGLFCNDVPLSDIVITDDVESTDGTAVLRTELIKDDNDGVPAELEDIDGNGDLTNDDTDGDGVPNYLDEDDDGDNVLTKDENPDPNGDGNLDDAQNSDDDDKADYLDSDDDNDGVLTRDEENNTQDQNPKNDETNSDIGPDYLNKDVKTTVAATKYKEHKIYNTYQVSLTVSNVDLKLISLDVFDFGLLDDSEIPNDKKSTVVETVFK